MMLEEILRFRDETIHHDHCFSGDPMTWLQRLASRQEVLVLAEDDE
jgi:hypothetical protein